MREVSPLSSALRGGRHKTHRSRQSNPLATEADLPTAARLPLDVARITSSSSKELLRLPQCFGDVDQPAIEGETTSMMLVARAKRYVARRWCPERLRTL